MIGNWKLLFVAAMVATSIAPHAFAQSSNPTGNQMPYYYDGTGKQIRGLWGPATAQATASTYPVAQRRGLHAYAMTPGSGRSRIHTARQR
jgi:hypothetical protein